MRLVLTALAATACADFRDCTEVDTSGVAALPVALSAAGGAR